MANKEINHKALILEPKLSFQTTEYSLKGYYIPDTDWGKDPVLKEQGLTGALYKQARTKSAQRNLYNSMGTV